MLEQNAITLKEKKKLKLNTQIVLLFISEIKKVYSAKKQNHHCIALTSLDLFNEKQSAGNC